MYTPEYSKAKTTKDAIISILTQKWPLTSKEIFNSLKKEHAFNGTYQAIHKTLNVLAEEKILEKKDQKKYSLNRTWVKNLKNTASYLEDHLLQNIGINELKKLEESGTANITLVGIRETARFLIDGLFRLPNLEKKPSIALWRNVYSIIGLSELDYEGLKQTMTNWYAVATENNLLDQMFAKTLSGYGVKIKLGVKEAATTLNDTFVVGDYVGVIWYPPGFRAMWDNQNKTATKLAEFDLSSHLKMMVDEKAIINIIITKNQVLADQIREKYLPVFKEERE